MKHRIVIQRVVSFKLTPRINLLRQWALAALTACHTQPAEVTIRLVDIKEMSDLNARYRHRAGPTNVLSFPFENDSEYKLPLPILGDIAICAEVVNEEAEAQRKSVQAHWAHIIVHGIFHLAGYDHQHKSDAAIMEAKEIEILATFGFPNPYLEITHHVNSNTH